MGARTDNAIGGVKGLIRCITFDGSANEKGDLGGLQTCRDRPSVVFLGHGRTGGGGGRRTTAAAWQGQNLVPQLETVRTMPDTKALTLAANGWSCKWLELETPRLVPNNGRVADLEGLPTF